MPPFITTLCPHCGEKNAYDLTNLTATQPGARVFRSVSVPPEEGRREYVVTCNRCHQSFKVAVPEKGGLR